MPTELGVRPLEQGSIIITVSFSDENGDEVVPNSVTWTLADGAGSVVNNRKSVSVTPTSSLAVVLSGDDLNCGGGQKNKRLFRVDADYDSTAGNGIPLKGEATFKIEDILSL